MKKHAVLLLALAGVLGMPLFMKSGSLASEVLIFALAAMACNLLLGYAGLLSFGQGVFFGLGSYTMALLLTRWPVSMPLALLCAVAAGALGAAVVGWIAIRQRGVYFVMLTLGLAQMVYFVAYSIPGITGGDNGLLDIPRPAFTLMGRTLWSLETPWQYYGFVAVVFMLVFWLMHRTEHSIFGGDPVARAAAAPRPAQDHQGRRSDDHVGAQNLEVCTQLADRHFIVEQGAIVYGDTNAAFIADDALKDRYLGVGLADAKGEDA